MYSMQVSYGIWSMSTASSIQTIRIATISKVANHSSRKKDITSN